MQIETPPTDRDRSHPLTERRGLVLVHTGDGKGKSTAAFGMALRAHGRGKAVKIYQFMKVPSARFGEVHVVLTGRNAPEELIELADTVTEMHLVKHHFRAGVPAQRGIED